MKGEKLQLKNKNWQKVKLGEVVDIEYGKDLPTSELKTNGFPVYGGNGIIGYSNVYLFEEPKIIVGCRGANSGNVFLTKPRSFVTHNSLVLHIKGRIDQKFLFYKLISSHIKEQVVTGSAQPQITIKELEQLEIEIPEDINEQRCIADILSAFDEKIELNNKINQILEEMAQAIFKEWFVKFRFPGWQKVKFVNSELGKIPEGWEVVKLGDILSLEYGKALPERDRKKGRIPVYASSGLVGYHNEKLVRGPGIIIGRAGIPGSVHWSDTDFWCVDSSFYVVSDISKYFLYYLLKYQNLESLVSGSAVPGLSRHMVYGNLAILPKEWIIRKFEELITPIFNKIYKNKVENQKLSTLRDLLLRKLMSGEIRV